jgi:Fe-S oxidoreductase
VERHRFFQASRSGVSRVADFYANSNVNTALDVVRLAVKKADEIRHRADAEAYKVHDVLEKNAVRYAVYCVFSDDRALKETNESVVQILGSAGASVITDIDGAVLTMQGT